MPFLIFIPEDQEIKRVRIAGFGYSADNNKTTSKLQTSVLTIVPLEKCLVKSKHFTKSHICATQKNTQACKGDSGGKIVN